MLYKITKHGRVGQITPKPQGSLADTLERYMSYKKQGAEFMPNPNWAWVRMYKINSGRFPWGMIEKVRSVLDQWIERKPDDKYEVDYKDPKFPEIKGLNRKLRYYQADAIVKLLINGGGILCLPTGAGKTFTAIEYLKILNRKTLVIVHTLDLKEQWEKQVPDFVDVVTYQSLKDKSVLKKYEVLIFDECFIGSTRINTKKGIFRIDSLYSMFNKNKELPDVLTYNEENKTFQYKKIKKVYRKVSEDLIKITLSKRVIKSTYNHKYLTTKGWIEAKNLKKGDLIIGNYGTVPVDNIEYIKNKDKRNYVYDLEVEDNHNYIVCSNKSDSGIVVHNCHHVTAKTIYDIAIKGGDSILVGLCVHPKTLVTIEGNSKKMIRDLKIGEKVLSYNFKEKKFENKKIVNKFETMIKDYYYKISVKIAGYNKLKTIRCSKDHKFKTNNGWIKAKDLKETDEIYTIDNLTYDVWNKGKKGTESYFKGKSYEEIYGLEKAKKIKKHLSDMNKGKKRTKESIEKFKETVRKKGSSVGDRNGMYTNGTSYMTRKLKREVKNCEECDIDLIGIRFRDVHVHHIDKDRANNDRSNLKVLCVKCHMKLHKELGDRRGRYSK